MGCSPADDKSLFVFGIETVLEQLRIRPPVLHIMYHPGIMALRQNKTAEGKQVF